MSRRSVFLSALLFLIACTGAAGGALEPDAATLDFGSLAAGGSASLDVVLTNAGPGDAVLAEALITGGEGAFTLGSAPTETIAEGETITLRVTFTAPDLAGSSEATLHLQGGITSPVAGGACGGGGDQLDLVRTVALLGASTGPADGDGDGYGPDEDCDDEDPDVNPGAAELCNDRDDDCDDLVDEDLPSFTHYPDGDEDAFGRTGDAVQSCRDALAGHALDGGDCDDEDAAIFPGAPETPDDGIDQDCSGEDTVTCFVDGDGDGFGGAATTTSPDGDCEAQGLSDTAGDCDDGAAAVFPGAPETPDDGIDQDCSGEDTVTCFVDGDGDGFGGATTTTSPDGDCDVQGLSDRGGDCDDGAAAVFPGAPETPGDGIDQDCNNVDATSCFVDNDQDGWGSTVVALGLSGTCATVDSLSSNDDDCDDNDGTSYPGAPEDGGTGAETGDAVDNDCDGAIDEGLLYGDGSDGALTVTGDEDLAALGGGCGAVTAIAAGQVTVDDATPFAAGDKVLLVNLQGDPGAIAALGTFELLDVTSVSGDTLAFAEDPVGIYGEVDNSALSGQAVALFRVPEFSSVTVSGSLTAPAFDGACGGVLAFVATGTVGVTGTIHMDGRGYRGGAQNTQGNSTGESGESHGGFGSKSNAANAGGGGGGGLSSSGCSNCEGTGGGGGHGTGGEPGQQANPALGTGGAGGAAYGVADGSLLTVGSGGGAGAMDQASEGGIGGAGGAGGGVLWIAAPTVTVSGLGLLSARGEDGEVGCAENTDWCGTGNLGPAEAEPGGGGAGGTLVLATEVLGAPADSLSAVGGAGLQSGSSWGRWAGDGGAGVLALGSPEINGQAAGTAGATTEGELVAEPDPGDTSGLFYETDCGDTLDQDGDGDVDCADSDCCAICYPGVGGCP